MQLGFGFNFPVVKGFGFGASVGVETRECCDGDKKYREYYFVIRGGPSFGASTKFATNSNINIITSGGLPKCLANKSGDLSDAIDINVHMFNINFSDEMNMGIVTNVGASARWNAVNKYRYWYRDEIGTCCE
ncbi:MAG: hypothetical protein ABW094_18690 [Candidatus Thiodiazotropha sp.]